jgi:peptidoglycan/LPS O-acetylase OafA/YrhL
MARDVTRDATRDTDARLTYMPALDGIRAVAVLAVLLYHAGVGITPGGFLGVDLFFVLSGYLITSLLILEYDRTANLDLGAFWLRRARRLLPALYVALLISAFHSAFLADPHTLAGVRGDHLATLFYASNWWFIARGQSYFEQFAAPSPLRHTWSLGIEEQWYIVWPLLLVLAFRVCRGRTRVLGLVAVAAALGSATLMAALFDPMRDFSRLYYGTDTRAQALLAGAALAFVLRGTALSARWGRVVTLLGVVGGVAFVVFVVHVTDADGWMYRGGFALLAGAAAMLVTATVQPGATALASVLSVRPLVAIGKISYGLYLYHWPLYVILDPARTGLRGAALVAIRLAATFALAIGSYQLIEMPVRRGLLAGKGRLREAATIAAAAPFVIVAAFAATVPRVVRPEVVARSGQVRVMLIGDSVATSLGEYFNSVRHPAFAVIPDGMEGCGVMRGRVQRPNRPPDPAGCENWLREWALRLQRDRPDVTLVLTGAWETWDRWVDGRLLRFGTPEFTRYFENELERGVALVRAAGGKVVLLTPPCYTAPDIDHHPGPYPPADHHEEMVAMLRDFATRHAPAVDLIDLAEFVCPHGVYRRDIDRKRFQRDGAHFTRDGAEMVWDWLAPQVSAKLPRDAAGARVSLAAPRPASN